MADMLKILFLSNRGLLPIKDGHTRRSFNILKGLSEYNQIYFLSLYEKPVEIGQANVEVLKRYCKHVEFYPAPKKYLSIQMISRLIKSLASPEPYTIWRHYSESFKNRANELMTTGKFDIVHCDILPISYTVQDKKDVFRTITDHDVSYLKCLRMGQESKNPLLKTFLYSLVYHPLNNEGIVTTIKLKIN